MKRKQIYRAPHAINEFHLGIFMESFINHFMISTIQNCSAKVANSYTQDHNRPHIYELNTFLPMIFTISY